MAREENAAPQVSAPWMSDDKISRLVQSNINRFRTLNGMDVDNRTQSYTPIPSPVTLQSAQHGPVTFPSALPQIGQLHPMSHSNVTGLGFSDTLTPNAYMAIWARMTPEQRQESMSGAYDDTVASRYADIERGKAVIKQNPDGSYTVEDVPIDLLTGALRTAAGNVGNTSDRTALARKLDLRQRLGSAAGIDGTAVDTDTAWRWLTQTYPDVARAAIQAGLTPTQVADINRTLNIKDYVGDLVAASEGVPGSEVMIAQGLDALPTANDRALAQLFLADLWEKSTTSAADAADRGENVFSMIGRVAWGLTAGPALDRLMWLNEQGQHYGRAQLAAAKDGDILSIATGILPNRAYWDETERGTLNQEAIESIRSNTVEAAAKNGVPAEQANLAVDIAIEVYRASLEGGDTFDAVMDKYRDNPVAWGLIQQGMLDSDLGDQGWLSDIYTQVAFADQGNMGASIVSSMGIDPTSMAATGIRDAVNTTAMFAYDPTTYAFGIGGAVRAARFGLWRLSGTANVEKAFSQRAVRSWFDWYGQQVSRIEKIADSTERGAATTTLLSQSKRYANSRTLELFTKHRIYNADDARDFMLGMEAVETVTRGRATPMLVKMKVKRNAKTGRKGKQKQAMTAPPRTWEEQVYLQSDDYARDVADLKASFSDAQMAGGKRSTRLLTPHQAMWTGWVKEQSAKLRGAADVTRLVARSTPVMDDLLGSDFLTLSRGQQNERLATVLANPSKVDELAKELSDLTGGRTLVGAALDRVVKSEEARSVLGLSRNGWRRKAWRFGFGDDDLLTSIGRRADRFAKVWARMPDTRGGLVTVDARDADKVYQMMRLAGVNRAASSEFRAAWITMTQGQRELASMGLFRTFGRASGLDQVNPAKFDELLGTVSGVRVTESYAPNSMPRYGAMMEEINAEARAISLAEKAQGNARPLSEIRAEVRARKFEEAQAGVSNPTVRQTVDGTEFHGAAWLSQTSDRVAMPNFAALDQYTARKSFLNAFLMDNRLGTTVTDMWTFATLAGPRFQIRNGLEDIVMYGITGGRIGGFAEGRRTSTVLASAQTRFNKKLAVARNDLAKAQKNYDAAVQSGSLQTQDDIDRLAGIVTNTQNRVKALEEMGQHKKFGVVNTARSALANKIRGDAGLAERENTLRVRFANAIFMPMSSAAERVAASASREAAIALQKKAMARQRLLLVRDPEARGVALRLQRGASIEQLSARQQQILKDIDQFLDSPFGQEYMDMAAETARHLADGTMPTIDDMAPLIRADGKYLRESHINQAYVTERVNGSGATIAQANGMTFMLNGLVTDGSRGQAVLLRLEDYWKAYNRAGSPDHLAMKNIVDDVTDFVQGSDMWHVYVERFRLNTPADARKFVDTAFRVAADMFTTPSGKFNSKLWAAMDDAARASKKTGERNYRIVAQDGSPVVSAEDFLPGGKYEPSYAVIVRRSDAIHLPVDPAGIDRFTDAGWRAMGRSLARMTREPIYMSNYLDARKALRPFEEEYARRFGAEAASRWAADGAAERAYTLTMAWTDNPAVRSQLAWKIRNIARFYRAQEDFIRRMYRMGRNNPEGFWKAALLWNATIDTGFTYTDEYGEEYFMYPLSRPGMELMGRLSSIGMVGDFQYQGFPAAISGNVAWLSPSADADQWMPTLASPVATFAYRPLLRTLPGFASLFLPDEYDQAVQDVGGQVDRAVFGAIGADNKLQVSAPGIVGEMIKSVPQALPPIMNKLFLGLLPAALGADVPGSYAAKASVRAALIMESAGHGITAEDAKDPEKLEQYARRLEWLSLAVSLGMIVAGTMLPAAPQLADDQLSEFGRVLDNKNLRPAWLSFLNREIEDGGDYWTAVEKWTRKNPDLGIYVLSQSEARQYGFIQPVEDNAAFGRKYRDVSEGNLQAFTLFMPNTGRQTLTASRQLQMFGVSVPAEVQDYAYKLATENAYLWYKIERRKAEDAIANASTPEQATFLRNTMEAWAGEQKVAIPGLASRLDDYEARETEQWTDIVESARVVAQAVGKDGNGLGPDFLAFYEQWWAPAKDDLMQLSANRVGNAEYQASRELYKSVWDAQVQKALSRYPGNEQWELMLSTMTKALDKSWDLPGGN